MSIFEFKNGQDVETLASFFRDVWSSLPESLPGHKGTIGSLRAPVAEKLAAFVPSAPAPTVHTDGRIAENTPPPTTRATEYGGFTVVKNDRAAIFRFNEKMCSADEIATEVICVATLETIIRQKLRDPTWELFSKHFNAQYVQHFIVKTESGILLNFRNHDIPMAIRQAFANAMTQ